MTRFLDGVIYIDIYIYFCVCVCVYIYIYIYIYIYKSKGKISRYRLSVAQRVGRSIALLFHDSGTRRG